MTSSFQGHAEHAPPVGHQCERSWADSLSPSSPPPAVQRGWLNPPTPTTFVFKVGSVGLSKRKKNPCTLQDALRHNLREIKAELLGYCHFDPARSHLNEFLIGSRSSAEIMELAAPDALVPNKTGTALRFDHAQAIELVFSLPRYLSPQAPQFFRACTNWSQKVFAGHQIYSAVIHNDQSEPHCHVLISPIRRGVRVGASPVEMKALRELRQSFWFEVAAPAGLLMPSPKLRGVAKQRGIQLVIDHLLQENTPCTKSKLWPVFAEAIKDDPARSLLLLNTWVPSSDQSVETYPV